LTPAIAAKGAGATVDEIRALVRDQLAARRELRGLVRELTARASNGLGRKRKGRA